MSSGVLAVLVLLAGPAARGADGKALPTGIEFLPGPVNTIRIKKTIVVYGDASARPRRAKHVLFTHARRDVTWAGAPLVRSGAEAIVPEAERSSFEAPEVFWQAFEKQRFHDYAQRTTKVPREPLRVGRAVRGGDALNLDGVRVEVMDSPGYTPGAVSYLVEMGGRRIACTGDLIYGDGQLLDVYSLQDAIPEAKLRGYHGFAARAGALVASLRAIAARKPDVLLPARGPMITNPEQAITRLVGRLQALMASHFATDALLWYFGADNLRIRSSPVLDGRAVESLPMAEQTPLPSWIIPIDNSRLILSSSGAAFLSDAGSSKTRPALEELHKQGRFRKLEGIWVTHYHDDHTNFVQQIAEAYDAPVYFTDAMTDILQHPSRHRLPCLTTNPIQTKAGQPDGRTLKWQEFELTFFNFPGQTLYHGGLLARRASGERIFFVGDSFTPSGMDDYCLQNRNLLREGEGYLAALDLLGRFRDAWLINQHVLPMFRFDEARLQRMRAETLRRRATLQELSPWPDPNYAVDESWARVYPYGADAARGAELDLELRILNHGPRAETYSVAWRLPPGLALVRAEAEVRIPPRAEGKARARVRAVEPGLHIVTADVAFGPWRLQEWTEAMVRVE